MKQNLANLDRDILQAHGRIFQEAFVHGITNDMIYGGIEPGQTVLQGLYADAQLVKNCSYGTRRVTWDGRVYRYSLCGAEYNIPSTERAVQNCAVLSLCTVAAGNNDAAVIPTTAKGVNSVTLAITATRMGNSQQHNYLRTGVIAKDNLKGGYISFRTGAFPSKMQTRIITGNTALAADGISITISFREPLNFDLTFGQSTCELLGNPYACVGITGDEWMSKMGMPNVLAEIGYSLWIQTWGILRISPTESLGDTIRERQFNFDSQGCVVPAADKYDDTTYHHQHAGYLVEHTYEAGSAAPFIMLQVCP